MKNDLPFMVILSDKTKEEEMSHDYNEDPTLLKIRGDGAHFSNRSDNESNADSDEDRKQYVKKLSSAILTVIAKHGSAKLKTVGASALSNAVKAAIVARGEAAKKGEILVIEPSFDDALFDGNVKTAIVLKVTHK